MEEFKLWFLKKHGLWENQAFLDLNAFSPLLFNYLNEKRYYWIMNKDIMKGKRPKKKRFDFMWTGGVNQKILDFIRVHLTGVCYLILDTKRMSYSDCVKMIQSSGLNHSKVGLLRNIGYTGDHLMIKLTL